MNNTLRFPMPILNNLVAAFVLALTVAVISLRLKFLTKSGVIATFFLAFVIYGLGGWKWTIPMFTFFFFSSILSQIRGKRNRAVDTFFEKSGQRDYMQVISNGGFAGLLVIINYFFHSNLFYAAYISCISAVCADTWATEIGTMSQIKTYNILNFKEIEQGISGGVSITGFLGAISGAFIIGLSSLFWVADNSFIFILLILFCGFSASIIDSILGSAIQVQNHCTVCNKTTERKIHCNKQTIKSKGFTWINNDVVNIISGICGAFLGYILSDFILY